MKLQKNDVVIAPDGRLWSVANFHDDMQNNVKCRNGRLFCYWPEKSLTAVCSVSECGGLSDSALMAATLWGEDLGVGGFNATELAEKLCALGFTINNNKRTD